MAFEQVFDNVTLKGMDGLRKQIQPLADSVLSYSFRINATLIKF